MDKDPFFIQTQCDRCGKSLANGRTMSRFNTQCICLACAEQERNHPRYQEAVEAERAALARGDTHFSGIGF